MIIIHAFCFSLVITGFILLIIFKPIPLAVIIYGVVILFVLFLYIYVLSITKREIQFIKNAYLNQLTIKIKKVCCFPPEQYTLMLENAYIHCEKSSEKGVKIFILNILKNPREIDLDKSNIKTTPINLLYEDGLSGNYDEIKSKIDNFLGERNYENNICDEINKYITYIIKIMKKMKKTI